MLSPFSFLPFSLKMVSVIIPNYNHAPYLKQRIDSVLEQTYRHFELIILDDCSTDNSREVIETYRDNAQISHIIYNETNSGSPFKQWQKGIELAQGKYIWLAESDDWCEPTLLETLVAGLEGNDSCVLAYVQSAVILGDNDIDKVSAAANLFEYAEGTQYIADYLVKHNSIFNAGMAVFKKQCYANVLPRFTDFKFCGDWLFWIGIARQGDVFISGKVLNYFRKHGDDVTGKMLQSGYNYVEELAVLETLFAESFIDEEQFKAQLLDLYTSYLLNRKRFTAAARKNIDNAFHNAGNQNYNGFLFWNANQLTLLKLKVKRRLQ